MLKRPVIAGNTDDGMATPRVLIPLLTHCIKITPPLAAAGGRYLFPYYLAHYGDLAGVVTVAPVGLDATAGLAGIARNTPPALLFYGEHDP